MKGVKKYLFLMAVVAALFGFVACSNDDDGASKVAVYASDEETFTFYDNNTFKNVDTIKGKKYTLATGTYKGDVTKDTGDGNNVTATVKKYAYVKKGAEKLTFSSIKDYAKYASKTYDGITTKEIIEYFTDMPVTIQDGELTILEETYTKKN